MGGKLLPCFYCYRHRNIVERCSYRGKFQQTHRMGCKYLGFAIKGWMLEILLSFESIRTTLLECLETVVITPRTEAVGKLGSKVAAPESLCQTWSGVKSQTEVGSQGAHHRAPPLPLSPVLGISRFLYPHFKAMKIEINPEWLFEVQSVLLSS